MAAKLDLMQAIWYFVETNKRGPNPQEQLNLPLVTQSTALVVSVEDYTRSWINVMDGMGMVPVGKVNWKEAFKWGL